MRVRRGGKEVRSIDRVRKPAELFNMEVRRDQDEEDCRGMPATDMKTEALKERSGKIRRLVRAVVDGTGPGVGKNERGCTYSTTHPVSVGLLSSKHNRIRNIRSIRI